MEQGEIKFPKKVVITVGKAGAKREIHIGHLAGGMIEADIYARFLKTQIGEENVLLFSGAECYGSSIIQAYEKNKDRFNSLEEYIAYMHSLQVAAISKFHIEFDDYFCITSNEKLQKLHTLLCQRFIDALQKQGLLNKEEEEMLIDPVTKRFLNYKQVGTVENGEVSSDGQKYDTANTHNLVSKISGLNPETDTTTNYFLNLEAMRDGLTELHKSRYSDISKHTAEYLDNPTVVILNKYLEEGKEIGKKFNAKCVEGTKTFSLSVESVASFNELLMELKNRQIEFSAKKVLDKCRITGNSEWGIKAKIDGESKNVWVWIDSMLEPISFTIEHLISKGNGIDEWKKWWCEDGASVCHFMAEDNIYFYTMVENSLLMAWNNVNQPTINYPQFHLTPMRVLFNGKYDGPFPTADLLLKYYTSEQIRYSIATMGKRNSSFNPEKLVNPEMQEDNITNKSNSYFRRIKRLAVSSAEIIKGNREDTFIASNEAVKKGEEIYAKYLTYMANRNFSGVINMVEERGKELLKDRENALYYTKLLLTISYPFFPEFTLNIYRKLFPDNQILNGYNPKLKDVKVNRIDNEVEI